MKKYVDRINVVEMRMLRWISSKIVKDRIRNVDTRDDLGVAPIEDGMRENLIKWSDHVYRKPKQVLV